MDIAYLSDSFAKRERFGLSRYSHELRDALTDLGAQIHPVSSCNELGKQAPEWLSQSGFRQIPIPRAVLATAWCVLPEPRVERWAPAADVVHSVDVDYPVATRLPWVLTIHDLGALSHPEYFGKARPWLLRRMLSAATRSANAVICISEATAAEVVRFAGPAIEARISIVPLGLHGRFFKPPSRAVLDDLPCLPEPGRPYFLFTGSMNPRKNLVRVLRAFASVAYEIPHSLVLAGALGWDSDAFLAAIDELGLDGRVFRPGYVSDEQLRALYANAEAYVFPSLFEGFGLPIIEAMASGCPVLTSNLSSMPEVAGGAAMLVDPMREADIAEGMLALGTDASLRDGLRTQGLARARTFDWSITGARTLDIYRGVA